MLRDPQVSTYTSGDFNTSNVKHDVEKREGNYVIFIFLLTLIGCNAVEDEIITVIKYLSCMLEQANWAKDKHCQTNTLFFASFRYTSGVKPNYEDIDECYKFKCVAGNQQYICCV